MNLSRSKVDSILSKLNLFILVSVQDNHEGETVEGFYESYADSIYLNLVVSDYYPHSSKDMRDSLKPYVIKTIKFWISFNNEQKHDRG